MDDEDISRAYENWRDQRSVYGRLSDWASRGIVIPLDQIDEYGLAAFQAGARTVADSRANWTANWKKSS
jgi:hypothetical protein